MAENLHLDVIAEGVESREHIESLTQLGCNVMQGYYYGKPMESEDVDDWVKNNKERALDFVANTVSEL